MKNLGEYNVGDRVHVDFMALSEYDPNKYGPFHGYAAYTSALPTLTIWGGANLATQLLNADPMIRDPTHVGHYWYDYVCTQTGRHLAIVDDTLAGGARTELDGFEVVADPSSTSGGSYGSGRIIAAYHYKCPEVEQIVWQTRAGDLVARQNPA